jgi:hypothetical protein
MAKATKPKLEQARALDELVGQSVRVDDGEGGTFIVPAGPTENRTANQILASQMRNYIQMQMKRYKEGDKLLTPAELRQLAEAAAVVARFSGEVYDKGESAIPAAPAKNVSHVETAAEPVDFSTLTEEKK